MAGFCLGDAESYFDVELLPDRVIIKINNEFYIEKDGERRKLENIKVVKRVT